VTDYPTHTLKSDQLTLTVYLPDAEKGFYRGTRFDWSGVFGVEFGKHKLFGPWKGKHDPTNNDDIVGPCEEFGNAAPLGYDTAKVGETFVKIGVGELEKPKEEKYNFFGKYKIARPGEWKVTTGDAKATFEQTISTASGYGYKYTKIVAVQNAEVRIQHVLENTGKVAISTDHYNHNFFNVDADPIGPNYSLKFEFNVRAENLRGKFGDWVEVKDKEVRFKEKFGDGFVMAGLTGFDAELPANRGYDLSHAPSGVRVKVFQSAPVSKFNLWGIKTTICPEPYTQIDLKPGGERIWRIVYTFEHDPPKK